MTVLKTIIQMTEWLCSLSFQSIQFGNQYSLQRKENSNRYSFLHLGFQELPPAQVKVFSHSAPIDPTSTAFITFPHNAFLFLCYWQRTWYHLMSACGLWKLVISDMHSEKQSVWFSYIHPKIPKWEYLYLTFAWVDSSG